MPRQIRLVPSPLQRSKQLLPSARVPAAAGCARTVDGPSDNGRDLGGVKHLPDAKAEEVEY